ncbi:hypothetical protein AB0I81_51605 [Nonomuraea sp. NPDC050404]|uniref:hypothetical protein n=1 Tax=Nonomuraea sp. NPDC050404 TaxID=3155783 RepID=UPI003402CA04
MPDESTSQDQARAEADALAAWEAIPYSVSHEEAQRISREYLDAARKEFEQQTGQLARAGQDTVRRAELELNANGREVYPITRWWGFELVLNAAAAQAAADISELVGDLVGNLLPRPIGALIEAAFKIRAIVIRAIGGDHGCRLVSPWVSPLMLIPIPLAPKPDTSLWWTVMNASNNWNQDEKFPAHLTRAHPALAEFRGRLYCVYRGDQNDSLWWTVYDPARNDGWTTDRWFPSHFSADGPALAVFNDRLYCVHRGTGNDQHLWWTRFDGTSWSADTRMNAGSSRGPALATFNGHLYCVYKSRDNDTNMWWMRFNGTTWSAETVFPGHRTSANPALAVFQNHLWCVHRGGGNDQNLYWTRFTGTSWAGNPQMPGHMSSQGPALAVFNNHLYCVHRGAGNDQHLWWTRFNGTSWSTDTRLPGHMSSHSPAIAAYREPEGTEDQLFCVHRGSG